MVILVQHSSILAPQGDETLGLVGIHRSASGSKIRPFRFPGSCWTPAWTSFQYGVGSMKPFTALNDKPYPARANKQRPIVNHHQRMRRPQSTSMGEIVLLSQNRKTDNREVASPEDWSRIQAAQGDGMGRQNRKPRGCKLRPLALSALLCGVRLAKR